MPFEQTDPMTSDNYQAMPLPSTHNMCHDSKINITTLPELKTVKSINMASRQQWCVYGTLRTTI